MPGSMSLGTSALVVVAVAFVFLCGANDGGSLLSIALRQRARSGVAALAVLGVAVLLGPGLFGLAVARTFTDRLVPPSTPHAGLVLLGGAVAAMALVLALTRRGVPTSITLALLGAVAGAAVGLGDTPQWSRLGTVLAIGAAAPFAGAAAGYLVALAARRVPAWARMSGAVRGAGMLAFTGQCLAYAANDGQKMFAVAAVAAAAAGHPGGLDAGWLPSLGIAVLVSVVFTLGSTMSLRRIVGGATNGLLAARPWQVVSAELAATAAVFGSAGIGVPVSMTQSTAGGLVGTGMAGGARQVRWQFTTPLVIAWVVTLPAGFAAGCLLGLAADGALLVTGGG